MAELRERKIPVHYLRAGDEITTARTVLTAVWPLADTVRPGQDANRYSLALLCDLDGVTLLSAGDLTGEYERYAARDADILKVSHHGSKTSTGEAFLQTVSPRLALITNSPVSRSLPTPHSSSRPISRRISSSEGSVDLGLQSAALKQCLQLKLHRPVRARSI